jgi:hypothetical protein
VSTLLSLLSRITFLITSITSSLKTLSNSCCECVRLIPDIYRTGLVLGTSSQIVILLIYNFSSYILGILFSGHVQSAHIVPMFLLVSGII